LYDDGRGVPQDNLQAASWYRKAAEQGNADAQYSLGRLYYEGRGVPQDYAQAAAWHRKAAEQGDAVAQGSLGLARISHRLIVDWGDSGEEKKLERPSFLCHNYVIEAWL
jgi:TPR repeat protein